MRVASDNVLRNWCACVQNSQIHGGRLQSFRIVDQLQVREFRFQVLDDLNGFVGTAAIGHDQRDVAKPGIAPHQRANAGLDMAFFVKRWNYSQNRGGRRFRRFVLFDFSHCMRTHGDL